MADQEDDVVDELNLQLDEDVVLTIAPAKMFGTADEKLGIGCCLTDSVDYTEFFLSAEHVAQLKTWLERNYAEPEN